MWLKCLWFCLISGAVMATFQEVPRAPVSTWPLINHRFYLLDRPSLQEEFEDSWKGKRSGPSLSVSNPIEVLRNRVLLEMIRRRNQNVDKSRIDANREFLKTVGKRNILPLRSMDQEKSESLDYYNSSGDVDWDSS